LRLTKLSVNGENEENDFVQFGVRHLKMMVI